MRHESPIYATPNKIYLWNLDFFPTPESQKKGQIPYNLHPSLKFKIEKEVNDSIPFLDMKIINESGRLSSTWYNKPADTGLIVSFHALSPKQYKMPITYIYIYIYATTQTIFFLKNLDFFLNKIHTFHIISEISFDSKYERWVFPRIT